MSTEITPKAIKHTLMVNSFWGGQERGVCIQLTPVECHDPHHDYAQLTQAEVLDLIVVLLEWTSENMRRKLSVTQGHRETKNPEGLSGIA